MNCYTIPAKTQALAYKLDIGHQETRQKIVFTDQETQYLIDSQKTFGSIMDLMNLGFLPKVTQSRTLDKILSDIILKNEIQIVSVFCPSYKIGAGQIGYNNVIGNTTKNNINTLTKLYHLFSSAGCKINLTIYFSDLLIENLDELSDTDFRTSLDKNYRDLLDKSPKQFIIKKLSALNNLDNLIGERGSNIPIANIEEDKKQIVQGRNEIFYKNILNWQDDKIRDRTEALATNYPYIAQALNESYQEAYLYWSESAYERYLLMPNLNMDLLFPKKIS
ncbi:MAG: hypothetical protein WCI79_00140 [Candidatus Saccharibacteria bacterium]